MAQAFLKQIADHFYDHHRSELHRYRFVFHNRRAGVFLCHYLRERADGATLLLPECTTLNALVRSRLRLPTREDPNNDLFIIFRIYLAYLRVMEVEPESCSMEDFYDLGQAILNDFDDIDKHQVDPERFTRNILAYKELQQLTDEELCEMLSERQWTALSRMIGAEDPKGLSPEELPEVAAGAKTTEMKRGFLKFWLRLPQLYSEVKAALRSEGLAYEGMMLRDAVERIEEGSGEPLTLTDDGMVTVFVGLNAQTPVTYRLLDHFRDSGRALFYWDYFTDPVVSSTGLAGAFVKRNTHDYPTPPPGDADHIDFEEPKQAEELRMVLVATPSAVAQTALISELIDTEDPGTGQECRSAIRRWLREHPCDTIPEGHPLHDAVMDPANPLKTAIVLPSEGLLLPLMGNLPESAHRLNVTMGYPVKGTPAAALFALVVTLRTLYYRRGGRFRLKEIIDLVQMSALSPFFDREEAKAAKEKLIRKLTRDRIGFATAGQVCEAVRECFDSELPAGDLLLTLFEEPEVEADGFPSGKALIDHLLWLSKQMIDLAKDQVAALGEEATEEAKEERARQLSLLTYLRRFILLPEADSMRAYALRSPEEAAQLFSFPLVADLLHNALTRARIPYEGEPLCGIQVMGLLETRGLDFDTLFIPDAAEGTLPAATYMETMIPYSLRKAYGLPSTDLQEQTRAYNFFRLMSRTRRVVFLYDNRAGDSSAGEPSRYVQLLRDVYGIPILRLEASYPTAAAAEPAGEAKWFSPEQVETFRRGLMDPSDRQRHLSASRMRDFLCCPRRFYHTAIDGVRDEENLSGLMDARDLGNLFHLSMKTIYEPYKGGKVITEGEIDRSIKKVRSVVKAAAEKLHLNSLDSSLSRAEMDRMEQLVSDTLKWDQKRIKEVEPIVYVGGEIELEVAYCGANFKLVIDRIDIQGDVVNVIDYKTGSDKLQWDCTYATDTTELADYLGEQSHKIEGGVVQLLYYCDLLSECIDRLPTQLMRLIKGKSLRPALLRVFDPERDETTLKVRCRPVGVGQRYGKENRIEDYAGDLPEEVKEHLRMAVKLILDPDFNFDVRKGNVDGCRYCPAASVCEKNVASDYLPR